MKKKSTGFTILELLAAVVIVGIILGLAVLAINKYIVQGHNTVDSQLEKSLVLAAKGYIGDNKKKLKLIGEDGLVVWYTTLKSNNYIANDLVDSNGNSCGKSYVFIAKNGSKYKYTGCVVCDNNGYNNTSGRSECTETFNNYLTCKWDSDDEIKLGVKQDNSHTFNLYCEGKGISYASNYTGVVAGMFSSSYGNIEIVKSNLDTSKRKNVLTAEVKYTVKNNVSAMVSDNLKFKDGSIEVKKAELLNDEVSTGKINIDGKGPVCTISGPYSDSAFKNSVSSVKGGSTVYYGISCTDDSGVVGNIEASGFNNSVDILNASNNGTKASATVKVTVGNSDGNYSLSYKADSVKDKYGNGNASVSSKSLTVDGTGPSCKFVGPTSDINLSYSKRSIDLANGSDYVYYGIVCTDSSGVNSNTFSIGNVINNGFSSISLEKTSVSGTETRFIIKAWANKGLTVGSTPYLSFDSSTIKDILGNAASGVLNSSKVTIADSSLIPKCYAYAEYASDYSYATVVGQWTDVSNLSKFVWTEGYSDPAWYMYSGTGLSYSGYSGNFSYTALYDVTENGFYWLHIMNTYGYTGHCVAYVYQIQDKDYEAPSCSITMEETKYYDTYKKDITETYVDDTWTRGNVDISFDCTDNVGVTSQSITSSGNVLGSTNATLSAHGTYSVDFVATDAAGNKFSESKTVKIDKVPPVCTITAYKFKGDDTSDKWISSGLGSKPSGEETRCNLQLHLDCYDSDSDLSDTKGTKTGQIFDNPYGGNTDNTWWNTVVDRETSSYKIIGGSYTDAYAWDKAGNKGSAKPFVINIKKRLEDCSTKK